MNATPRFYIPITPEDLAKIDLSQFAPFVPQQFHHFFFGHPGFGPYYLLAHFSTLFKQKSIVEIGVHNGWGCLALSYSQNNWIYGYDLDLNTLNSSISSSFPQMHFEEGLAHEKDPYRVLSSPFIHFDALHDGGYERTFLDFLIQRKYEGWVLWDDIYLNDAMRAFWAAIPEDGDAGIVKHDLTTIGHETGSGLTCFGGAR